MEKYVYYSKVSRVLLLLADFCIIIIAFKLPYLSIQPYQELPTIFLLIFILVWWIVSGLFKDVHRINGFRAYKKSLFELLVAYSLHIIILMLAVVSLTNITIPYAALGYCYILAIALTALCRFALIYLYKYYSNLNYGQYNKVVIVGAGQTGNALYNFFNQNNSFGQKFLGFFDDECADSERKELIIGGLKDLKAFCLSEKVDEIYFSLPLECKELIEDLAKFSDDNFIHFRIIPDFGAVVPKNVNMYFIDSIPVITIRKEPLEIIFNKIIKRSFDIVFSLFVICTIFPFILPIIALVIKLTSPGPIFFKQLRPGKKNRLFYCFKFRTMRINNQTELQATKHDPRITSIGRFLRKTNLDELPQFFNVLLGDMSVVGPRPNMITQLEEYSKVIDKYKVRHFVNPGITGYAQVNGYRGETKQLQLMEKRVEYDVLYMENWSFFLDLKIIFLTVWNMIKGEKNAY